MSVTARETPEQADRRVRALLSKWQAETGLPVPPCGSNTLPQLSAEWAAEDARMTGEEIVAEQAFWANYEQAILSSPGVVI